MQNNVSNINTAEEIYFPAISFTSEIIKNTGESITLKTIPAFAAFFFAPVGSFPLYIPSPVESKITVPLLKKQE